MVATLIGRHADEMLTLFEAWSEEHADSPLPVAVRASVEASIEAHFVEPELLPMLQPAE